jgi:malonate-semialdehyde dehydrogenase (acetylating)/methylmalonate-semialdehyde dehydrogenase
MALSTLVMVGETKDWLPELAERAKGLSVNGGFEEGSDVGPVISPQSKKRIEDLIASAEKEGATILLDGRGYKPEKYPNGNWVSSSTRKLLLPYVVLTDQHRLLLPSSPMSLPT